MSNPVISQITLPSGTTYDIKDAVARGQIAGSIVLRGETSTVLTDNATTNPITINNASYTAIANDAVFYSHKEFVFDGTYWHEFGDMSGLGALAAKDNASATYTPEGSIAVSSAGSTASVTPFGTAGSLPSLTMTVSSENLTISFDQGALPTSGTAVTVKTGDASYAFTGTEATITAS